MVHVSTPLGQVLGLAYPDLIEELVRLAKEMFEKRGKSFNIKQGKDWKLYQSFFISFLNLFLAKGCKKD